MVNQVLVDDFYKYFTGNTAAYGQFVLSGDKDEKGKVAGKAQTITKQITKDNFLKHLEGETGLGVVPINYNNQCRFGVIDIDEYNIDLKSIHKSIIGLHLPLVLFRSKSGGAHIYIFLETPTNAGDVIATLDLFKMLLGYPKAEVFPKQKELKKGAVGNWINLPYFGGDKTERYAYNADFKKLDLYNVIKLIKESTKDISELKAFTDSLPLKDAPPCLQRIFLGGVPVGGRNIFLFNMGIYLKQKFPDNWENELADINNKIKEPLSLQELNMSVINSLKKKEYCYQCDEEPLKSFCNRELCKTREFGIESTSMPSQNIGTLTKYVFHGGETSYEMEVDGKIVKFDDTADLFNPSKYQENLFAQTGIISRLMKRDAWHRILGDRAKTMVVKEASEELSEYGQVKELLRVFIGVTMTAVSREQMLVPGRIFIDPDGNCFFRSQDFIKFISDRGLRGVKNSRTFNHLTEMGIQHSIFYIDTKPLEGTANRRKTRAWRVNLKDRSIFEMDRDEEINEINMADERRKEEDEEEKF